MKSKILIFILCFCTIFVCFVIGASADADEGYFVSGEKFIFNERLSDLQPSTNSYDVYFVSNDIFFSSIVFSYRGYPILSYVTTDNDIIEVYGSNGWVNETYRTIEINSTSNIPYEWRAFLLSNEQAISVYDTLKSILSDAIFGGTSLTSLQELSIDALCICLSVCVVLLPLVLVFYLIKFFISCSSVY